MELQDIDIKPIERLIKEIDLNFGKLRIKRSKELINDLEYSIYSYSTAVSDLNRIYTRNRYTLEKEKNSKFGVERLKLNSDLSTTKKINKDYLEENTLIELQKQVVDWLIEKRRMFIRLADHINSQRIGDLADAKRQQI